jgi:spore coat protein U-like protein
MPAAGDLRSQGDLFFSLAGSCVCDAHCSGSFIDFNSSRSASSSMQQAGSIAARSTNNEPDFNDIMTF